LSGYSINFSPTLIIPGLIDGKPSSNPEASNFEIQ